MCKWIVLGRAVATCVDNSLDMSNENDFIGIP